MSTSRKYDFTLEPNGLPAIVEGFHFAVEALVKGQRIDGHQQAHEFSMIMTTMESGVVHAKIQWMRTASHLYPDGFVRSMSMMLRPGVMPPAQLGAMDVAAPTDVWVSGKKERQRRGVHYRLTVNRALMLGNFHQAETDALVEQARRAKARRTALFNAMTTVLREHE